MSEHPKDRAWEPEDPMLMQGTAIPGEPEVMLQCLVEEYGRQGWSSEQILRLFESPFFQATYGLSKRLTGQDVRARIESILARTGVMRFRTVHATEPVESVESLKTSGEADCGSCEHAPRKKPAPDQGDDRNG